MLSLEEISCIFAGRILEKLHFDLHFVCEIAVS